MATSWVRVLLPRTTGSTHGILPALATTIAPTTRLNRNSRAVTDMSEVNPIRWLPQPNGAARPKLPLHLGYLLVVQRETLPGVTVMRC
jgi:hypothetical protein